MKRSDFLKKITVIGAGIGTYVGVSRACIKTIPTEARKIAECYIAGYFFYSGEKIEHTMKPGKVLLLMREKDNVHDSNAIEISDDGVKLGYMPRYCNEIPANMMDSGIEIYCRIKEINQAAPTWERIKIELMI